MKQVNFSHPGGFPLEQETLERLQTAYRSELYGALKRHLSIKTSENYIIAPATSEAKGWAIIHQPDNAQTAPPTPSAPIGQNGPTGPIGTGTTEPTGPTTPHTPTTPTTLKEGILYPIKIGTVQNYLKTTRKGTNLTFAVGTSETAYFDYEAEYISQADYNNAINVSVNNNDALTVYYYDLTKFKIVKDIDGIEKLISDTNLAISALSNSVTASLALKADKTEVVNLSNSVTTSLALKADKTEVTNLSNTVTTSLALKADKTEVASLSNTVTTSLALKADKTEVTNLSNTVTTSLALKAEKTTVDELLAKVVTIEEKLGTIARGAEVNVQADFGVTDQNNDAYIKGKPATAVSDILARGSFDIGDIGTDNLKTVYFTQINTYDYMILGSIRSKGANWNNDNDVIWSAKPINTFAFELHLREVSGNGQNIAFDYIIVKK